jgi:hypothetical protein
MAMSNLYVDMTDPIFDIQETIDRNSRRLAVLYRGTTQQRLA